MSMFGVSVEFRGLISHFSSSSHLSGQTTFLRIGLYQEQGPDHISVCLHGITGCIKIASRQAINDHTW